MQCFTVDICERSTNFYARYMKGLFWSELVRVRGEYPFPLRVWCVHVSAEQLNKNRAKNPPPPPPDKEPYA